MKRIKIQCLLSLAGIFFLFIAHAQTTNYIGMTAFGGTNYFGCIFSGDVKKFNFSMKYSFTSVSGMNPYGSLVQVNDSVFYGMCSAGGAHRRGTIFRISSNGVFAKLRDLADNDGVNPFGSLIKGTDGRYYGMCPNGGTGNAGTIFSIDSDSSFIKIKDFNYDQDGANPNGSLVLGADSNFYGLCNQGGVYDFGTIFKISPAGVFTKLKDLSSDTDGGLPYGSLVRGTDGNFYGMCSQGGANQAGTIFKISSLGVFTKLHDFSALSDGSYPEGSLVQGIDGYFYGVCSKGGVNGSNGTVFKISSTGTFTKLHDMYASSDGSNPNSSLVQDTTTGIFYGTCSNGGGYNYGTVFKFNPIGILTRLGDFYSDTNSNVPNGAYPYGSLILTSSNIKTVTGIAEASFSEVDIYPNPNQGVFTIKVKGKSKIELINALGRKEDELEMFDRTSITVKGKGLYFVRIYSGNSYKVVKVMVE